MADDVKLIHGYGPATSRTAKEAGFGNVARVTFKLSGTAIERLTKKLAEISQKAATQAIQKGMAKVCQLISKAAKANIKRNRTGALRKSIGWAVKTYPSKTVIGIVGPRRGFAVTANNVPKKYASFVHSRVSRDSRINPVKYAHLVEFGRGPVRAGTAKGKGTGKRLLSDGSTVFGVAVAAVPPRPFLRPAWDANKGKIGAILARHINAALRAVCVGRTASAGAGRSSPSLAV